MIYCPTTAAKVLNIWCSVAHLLLRLPPVYLFLPATGTLFIYDRMLWSYDVHMKNSRQIGFFNNQLPESLRINNNTNGLWLTPIEWSKSLVPTDVENIDAKKFQKNSTSTRNHGKQWTYRALNIFELCICEYDHHI